MNRVWIPGWQFSGNSFAALLTLLDAKQGLILSYENNQTELNQWLDSQIKILPDNAHIIGWSLGAMLACLLAQRSSKVKKISVIAANTQFSGAGGLPTDIAEAFMARYKLNPTYTRKRFASLVDSENSKQVLPFLIEGDQSHTLQWLYDIDLHALQLTIPIEVLLADNDQLVPFESAQKHWLKNGSNVTAIKAKHGLVITQADVVAQWIKDHE